jgi:diguanylate cyclase (GGDEF)-like protein
MPAVPVTDLQPSLILLSALLAGMSFGLLCHGLRKTRSHDTLTALGWWVAGAITTGTGLWSAQLLALCALSLPGEAGFQPSGLGLAWLATTGGVMLMLGLQRLLRHDGLRMASAALLFAMLWGLLQQLGVQSLGHTPLGSAWQRLDNLPTLAAMLLLPMTLVGVGAWLALWIVFAQRWTGTGTVLMRHVLAGAVLGLFSGMAQDMALGQQVFDRAMLSDAVDLLSLSSVEMMVAGGAVAVLLGLFGALVDLRAHGHNRLLASSLSEANRRLRDQAMNDPLTRLPNRWAFEERLDEALAKLGDEPGSLAVLFIDLDGFKPINDSFGHLAGDAVLREVGTRLQASARKNVVVARIGGDEFLMLAEQPGGQLGAARLARQALDAVAQPCMLPNGVPVTLSCSVGIVMAPEHGPGPKLIANADAAMYAAKRAGGSTFSFFDPSMEHDARDQLQLQHDLRSALDRSELELYYQPKIHAESGQVTGAEALVRWHHPSRGLVGPDQFIPIAERFGLIGALGGWVLDESCRQMRLWQDQGLRMRVAINLSAHQLRQDDLVERVRGALGRHRIDATLLTFEITETVAMEDTDVTRRSLAHLAKVGATVAIDDFGTGYSSLSSLPARQLKIDRSFIADLDHSPDARAIVHGIISLAHALDLQVVAEGVETERQRDILLALDCDELQGFLYAKPMPAAKLTLWAMGDDTQFGDMDFRASIYGDLAAAH